MIFPPGCDVCLSDEFVKIVRIFLNRLRKSCKKLIQKKKSCPIQWRQGMFTDISELMLFIVRFTIQISYQNYLKIMLEFFQNLFKILGKPCWESSPSASCDNAPRKPQYRKLRFLWKYKLACIFCRPSAKRRGQHDHKDLRGYALCRWSPFRYLEVYYLLT